MQLRFLTIHSLSVSQSVTKRPVSGVWVVCLLFANDEADRIINLASYELLDVGGNAIRAREVASFAYLFVTGVTTLEPKAASVL